VTDSVAFEWADGDFEGLMRANEVDEAVQITLRYIPGKQSKVLEAGAGTGRVVRYLVELGFEDVHGIELNEDAVAILRRSYPELKVIQGDIMRMPYDDATFDVVASYGVVEHFPSRGVVEPLLALYRVLKPGGIAVATVPSFNTLRQLLHRREVVVEAIVPRRSCHWRKLLRKSPPPARNREGFLYHVYPQYGPFFEYRLRPHEFLEACAADGFEIVESRPIYHVDGLYHTFGEPMVRYVDWRFELSARARALNRLLRTIPFFHNHMHIAVLQKPATS
jgi:SAM-dependent methyltransferase